jgi:hypothetical protein
MAESTAQTPPPVVPHAPTAVTSVGIVGGGKAGLQFTELFIGNPMVRLAFVVDRAHDAPAIVAARAAGVPTFTDLNSAIASATVDYIYEVTGSDAVVQLLTQALVGRPTSVITHDMAHILTVALKKQRADTARMVLQGIQEIKHNVSRSLDSMAALAESIQDSTNSMRVLSLNARIEAARAGQAGAGFGVVAQEMGRAADTVRDLTTRIEQFNETLRPVIAATDQLASTLEQLA